MALESPLDYNEQLAGMYRSWQAGTAPVAFLSSSMLAGCNSREHTIASGMLDTR